jgi:hypothetical protein
MRAYRLWTCLALAVLTLAWSGSTASAQPVPVCRPVSGIVHAGQSFHGAYCPAVTYMTINHQTLTTTTCRCTACIGPGGWVTHAQCTPVYLIKTPTVRGARKR